MQVFVVFFLSFKLTGTAAIDNSARQLSLPLPSITVLGTFVNLLRDEKGYFSLPKLNQLKIMAALLSHLMYVGTCGFIRLDRILSNLFPH